MTKENFGYLIGGLAFGILIGVGLYNWLGQSPTLHSTTPGAPQAQGPAGPMAPTQVGSNAADGAPMMAEIRALKQTVEQNPGDHVALIRLANLYHEAAMWDEAIGYYDSALQVTPGDPNLLTDMGICFRGKREYERALELFEEAHRHDPAHWKSLFNSAVVAGFDLGRFDDALASVTVLEGLNPPPPNIADLRAALEEARQSMAQRDQGSS